MGTPENSPNTHHWGIARERNEFRHARKKTLVSSDIFLPQQGLIIITFAAHG
jgi:hypothetical protein